MEIWNMEHLVVLVTIRLRTYGAMGWKPDVDTDTAFSGLLLELRHDNFDCLKRGDPRYCDGR